MTPELLLVFGAAIVLLFGGALSFKSLKLRIVELRRYALIFIESIKPKNAEILAILSTRRSGKAPAGLSERQWLTVQFYVVGLIALYILYAAEAWLQTQYTFLSTSGIVGFAVIGVITLTVIAYLAKRLNANKVV